MCGCVCWPERGVCVRKGLLLLSLSGMKSAAEKGNASVNVSVNTTVNVSVDNSEWELRVSFMVQHG